MIHRPGILQAYDRHLLTLAVVLSTLFVFPPAHSAGEDFLDNISKLEIQHPPPSDSGAAESPAGQQRPGGGSITSKQASQKPASVRKAAGQNSKADNTIAALRQQNAELSAAVKAAEKRRDETTRTLTAQIAALEARSTAPDGSQNEKLNALSVKNAELTTAAEAAKKKHDAAVAVLTDKNKTLQSALDQVAVKDDKLNLADKNNKNAYALGVFYLTQALSAMEKMTDDGIKLAPAALVFGFNDAYHQKLKIKESEIEKAVNALNDQMSAKIVDIDNKIMAKIKNKKYETLPNGVYFVVDKKGKEKYKPDELLSMNILEKKLDGTPILNTMNSSMVYDKQTDPLMDKVLSSGFKGGTVTLYGQAGSLYNPPPEAIHPTTLISITFELLP